MTRLPKDVIKKLSPHAATIAPKFKKDLLKSLLQGEKMSTNSTKTGIFSFKNFIPIAGASLLLVGVVGVGTYMLNTRRTENAALREISLPTDLSDLKPIEEIRTLASVGLAADTTIFGVELEQEDGELLYKVRFSDGSFKLYNAKTGLLVVKSSGGVEDEVPANFIAGISVDRARQIAQEQRPGATIIKIELEMEEGIGVYTVRFSDSGRIDVSAVDGTIRLTEAGDEDKSDSNENSSDDSHDDTDDDSHDDEDSDQDEIDDSSNDSVDN